MVLGNNLIAAVPTSELSGSGYLNYLKAVIAVEKGNVEGAKQLIADVRKSDPYAIEPALLMVNLLGHRDFMKNNDEITKIADEVENNFDDDKYKTPYGLLALKYRIAHLYFRSEKYDEAEAWFDDAYREVPLTQKYLGNQQVANSVRLGKANSLHLQGNNTDADQLMNEILDDAGSFEEKMNLLVQYVGFGARDGGA